MELNICASPCGSPQNIAFGFKRFASEKEYPPIGRVLKLPGTMSL
jgi:hypothetical protein